MKDAKQANIDTKLNALTHVTKAINHATQACQFSTAVSRDYLTDQVVEKLKTKGYGLRELEEGLILISWKGVEV